ATFRSDSDLSDGRRPDAVFFSNPKEDANRRDFTINGMFYDPVNKEVIDYVNGQEDLKKKVLRFIGDPDLRIREDYLRLLRAARFKFTFGFTYANTTFRAVRQSAHFVTKTSGERIRDELGKMFKACSQQNRTPDLVLQELDHTGLLAEILPEVTALQQTPQPAEYHAEGDVYVHTLRCLRALHPKTDELVIWAVLLHDIGKPACMTREGNRLHFRGHEEKGVEIAEKILMRLRFRTTERERVLWLIDHHMMLLAFGRMREAKRRRWFMDPRFPDLLQVMYADSVGTSPTDLTWYNDLVRLYEQERDEKLLMPPVPLLNGDDLMQEFNLSPGKEIGALLEMIHDAQIEGAVRTREEALEYIRAIQRK
ncbi:MAG TPA: HD domain-containing protein, partial [bacterium]|nr:HD domain-containing protein [bacterium]